MEISVNFNVVVVNVVNEDNMLIEIWSRLRVYVHVPNFIFI